MNNKISKIHSRIRQYVRPYRMNIYLALLFRIVVILFFFQQARVLFYILNKRLFPDTSVLDLLYLMKGGLVFDLTATLYVNSLYIILQILPFRFTTNNIYQNICRYLFFLTNGIAILINLADIAYYPFTLRRSTALVVEEFSNETNMGGLLLQFMIDYWFLFIIAGMVLSGLVMSYSLVRVKTINVQRKVVYYPLALVMAFISVVLFVGGVRGGFSHSTRPITISNASQYITHTGEEGIVLNTPFSLIRTIGEESLPRVNYMSQSELQDIYSPIHPASDSIMNKRNVVVIIWESMAAEYVGGYNTDTNIEGYKGYTPFIDSLMQHSTYFTQSQATGRKSIDAMASIFASIPSLTQPFILSTYSNNTLPSMPQTLKKEGYTTSFFHGAPNGSMGLLAFSKKLGIENYYGKTEYDKWKTANSDFDGIWGIWDDKFLEYFNYEISQMREPFFTSVFTLSSHHPFKVPSEYEGMFDEGTLPVHKPMGYTDMALKHFFERAKQEEWYDNTIFIITADHSSQSYYPYYQDIKNQFRVPIIIFDPQKDTEDKRQQTAAQTDIYPTVMGMLNYNKPFFSFGFDLLNSDSNFAVNYLNGYILHYQDECILFNDNRIIVDLEDKEKSTKMETMLKAFIQEFNNRMIDDNLKVN